MATTRRRTSTAAYAPANAATGQYGTISASLGGALSHGTSGRSSVRPHGPTEPTEPSASVPVPLGAGAGAGVSAGSGMNGNGAVMAALLFGVAVVVVGVVGAVGVGAGPDHREVLVELHVDLAAVGHRHLDLVVALLVADLGPGHPAASGLGQRGLAGALERVAGDRDVGTLVRVGVRAAGRHCYAGATDDDRRGTGRDGELLVDPHEFLLWRGFACCPRSWDGDLTAS